MLEAAKKRFGVVIALVSDNEDPENLGRVKVRFPWLDGEPESEWCRVCSPFAGGEHGLFCAPELDTEALVAFEHGNFLRPFVVGFLWGGSNLPPFEELTKRTIKSVSGNTIVLDDTAGEEAISITDKHGNSIVMNAEGIEITAKKISITADGEVKVVGSPIQLNP